MDQNLLKDPSTTKASPYDLVVGPGRSSGNREFGALLMRVREHAGLSRADAAATLGVSAEYLRLIELGRRTPALGQMPSFLDAYHANGAVGLLQPGGERPDLILMDPRNDEPVLVEFMSRIREARRSTTRSARDGAGQVSKMGFLTSVFDAPAVSHAADLGFVVTLLAHADPGTVRKVREWLQDELGNDLDNEA
ncbi:helix-turn-helix domain-containing protein [Pseudarthrobacter oxydans]|nr:helix-turn-helix transcriptional regulator [Pseudarthrobacter oxydans]